MCGVLPSYTCWCLLLCMAPKVLEQTLSPLWDELLVFDQLIVDGRREQLQEEPPLVVISVFDHNKFVSVAWLHWGSWPCPSYLLFVLMSSPTLTPHSESLLLSSLPCSS
jgi:hypothetical protein